MSGYSVNELPVFYECYMSGFDDLKSKSGSIEEIDRLNDVINKQLIDDRRQDPEQSWDYKKSKRQNVLGSLSSNGSIDLLWKMELCKKYNQQRYFHPTRRVEGPWWNKVIKDKFVLDDKEVSKARKIEQKYHNNEISYEKYRRLKRRLKWVELDKDDEVRNAYSSFKGEKDLVSPKALEKYLKKTSKKEPCQSLWCPNCRKVASELYLHKVEKHIERNTYINNDNLKGVDYFKNQLNDTRSSIVDFKVPYNNDHLKHITGIVGLYPVDVKIVKDVLNNQERLKWRRINNRLGNWKKVPTINDPWIECVYEFELVNWEFLRKSKGKEDEKKREQINLLKTKFDVGNVFLFVHFHGVTNLTKPLLSKVFEREYWLSDDIRIPKTEKQTGLYVQSLHSTKSLKQNLEKICSYPFKDPYRFKHSFAGSDYANGEYYSKKELNDIITFYQEIQGKNWKSLFRSCSIDNIKERDRIGSFYTETHPVWGIMDRVYLVDNEGNVFKDGWDPDKHPSFKHFNVIERVVDRTPSGKRYGWYAHYKPHKLLIYKNIYDESSYYERWKPTTMTLWEYYHSQRVKHTSNIVDKHITDIEVSRRTHGRDPTLMPNPKRVMDSEYQNQLNGLRTVIDPFTNIETKGIFHYVEIYEEAREYLNFLKDIGIGRDSLSFKRWSKITDKGRNLDYIDNPSSVNFKTIKKNEEVTTFNLIDGKETWIEEVEYNEYISYDEWVDRERKDTYPKNYKRNYLMDFGFDDDEVFDVIEDEIENETHQLLLPPPNP